MKGYKSLVCLVIGPCYQCSVIPVTGKDGGDEAKLGGSRPPGSDFNYSRADLQESSPRKRPAKIIHTNKQMYKFPSLISMY